MVPKPDKPTPDYPLYAHGNGRWAKKIDGKTEYFGPWSDPQGALDKYLGVIRPKVSTKPKAGKPVKPRGFPLTPHPNGQWVKMIRGKREYFGVWANPQAALEEYKAALPHLLAGRRPPTSTGGLTVGGLAARFLTSRLERLEAGDIASAPRTSNSICLEGLCG